MDVRTLVEFRSITDFILVIQWLSYGCQGFGIVQVKTWPKFLTSSACFMDVSYWHCILTSIQVLGMSEIWSRICQFLTLTSDVQGCPVDVRPLVRYMSFPDIFFWRSLDILRVIWSDIWPILTSPGWSSDVKTAKLYVLHMGSDGTVVKLYKLQF